MAFMRGSLLFVFNFNPVKSFNGYGFRVPEGKYTVELNTDAEEFGGYAIADDSVVHSTEFDEDLHADGKGWMKTYIPARSAVVMRYSKSKG
jgi:1,4-alpha-glucan branching enzyme